MPKKKNARSTAAPAAPASRPKELSDVVKPRDSSREELENLKTLNHMLLKETLELREQVADLRSKLDVLSEEHGFMSSIEQQVSGISLSALLRDALSRLDAEAREKGEIKKSLDVKEIKIQHLESKIVCLEKQMEDMATKNEEAVNRVRSGLGALEVEKEEVKRRLAEKEHVIEELNAGNSALQKARKETESILSGEIDVLGRRVAEMAKEKEEIGRRLDEREHDIQLLECKLSFLENEKRGMELKLMAEISELEQRMSDRELYFKLVEDEKGEREKVADGLRVQVMELKKSKSESEEALAKLKVMLQVLQVDNDAKKKNVDALMEDKELNENKLKDAELKSVRLLAMLKSTAGAMQCREDEKENVVDCEMDEDVGVFAAEMNAIKDAFKCGLAEERAKKKGGFWGWVYPATSTVVAAVSLAYAVKGR